MKQLVWCMLGIMMGVTVVQAQRYPNTGYEVKVVPDEEVEIFFDRPLRAWDGFGVNYVEACQTRDYAKYAQDYSGFSFAQPATKATILEMIFGKEGLRPGLTKLFLDPFHEGKTEADNDNADPLKIDLSGYDHMTTTQHMRAFNREGMQLMQTWGGELQAIATLYGPAPWMTRQDYVLGRDLDENQRLEVAEYLASWAKYLKEKEGIPVRYISFHNEGDAYYRWPRDGSNPGEDHRDYNMYWPPEQVVDFLDISRKVLDANGLEDVGLSTGETQSWYRFDQWGYATAITHNAAALNNLDLMASHSFAFLDIPNSVYYGDFRSIGQDLIRAKRPEVKAWVTSMPWADGVEFAENIRRNIYECKINGLIPWAIISGANQWMQSDGTYSDGSMKVAFKIQPDGSLQISPRYFFYKQLTRAGQPGTSVCQVVSKDPAIGVLAFTANDSRNTDAFVIINKSDGPKDIQITIKGAKATGFEAFRTSDTDFYQQIEDQLVNAAGIINYTAPARSVTSFFAK